MRPQLEFVGNRHLAGYSQTFFRESKDVSYTVVTGGCYKDRPVVYRNGYPFSSHPSLIDHLVTQALALNRLFP